MTWWVSKRVDEEKDKQNNRYWWEKTAENRRRIGNTWRLENSRNALWTEKAKRILRHRCGGWAMMCFIRGILKDPRARWGPPPSIHPPSTGGGIDIAARLRFLIAHKWDRTGRRPLRWVGATTIVIPCEPIVVGRPSLLRYIVGDGDVFKEK
jgi:hypothetical protein